MSHPQIIIAWMTLDGTEETGRLIWRDGIQRKETQPAPLAKALVWSHSTPEGDELTKAQAWAKATYDTAVVFVYPAAEENPLGRARTAIMEMHKAMGGAS